ncbi:MAG: hypothetical protein RMJ66_07690 [Bacteroidia bacterium]|nr:hypothetical protein [Bacteroidia bacterium]
MRLRRTLLFDHGCYDTLPKIAYQTTAGGVTWKRITVREGEASMSRALTNRSPMVERWISPPISPSSS